MMSTRTRDRLEPTALLLLEASCHNGTALPRNLHPQIIRFIRAEPFKADNSRKSDGTIALIEQVRAGRIRLTLALRL